jgi:hypothetical protein
MNSKHADYKVAKNELRQIFSSIRSGRITTYDSFNAAIERWCTKFSTQRFLVGEPTQLIENFVYTTPTIDLLHTQSAPAPVDLRPSNGAAVAAATAAAGGGVTASTQVKDACRMITSEDMTKALLSCLALENRNLPANARNDSCFAISVTESWHVFLTKKSFAGRCSFEFSASFLELLVAHYNTRYAPHHSSTV